MKRKLLTLFCIAASYITTAQTTNIPDPVFEQLLIDKEIDSDGIVNGQISNVDALAATSLTITYDDNVDLEFINDLTGIEAFTNLDSLTVNFTMIEELNVSTLVKLKYLDCVDNMLTSLDVSNNPLLEHINISTGGDVGPLNSITEIDLSHNPNIKKVLASGGIDRINLKNGNNNPDMYINISAFYIGGPPPNGHTCIEVDDSDAAQNNQSPYSEWTIIHQYQTYSLVADCSLSTKDFNAAAVSVHPNPASDVLYFEIMDTIIDKAVVLDISGRIVKENNHISGNSISVSDLQAGTYILKLITNRGSFTQKVIKH